MDRHPTRFITIADGLAVNVLHIVTVEDTAHGVMVETADKRLAATRFNTAAAVIAAVRQSTAPDTVDLMAAL